MVRFYTIVRGGIQYRESMFTNNTIDLKHIKGKVSSLSCDKVTTRFLFFHTITTENDLHLPHKGVSKKKKGRLSSIFSAINSDYFLDVTSPL